MKTRRYVIFYALFALTALMISARLINLQIANGSYYREKSNSRTVRSVELAAPRGEILDRNGRAIVSNRTGYNVYILSNRERTNAQLNKVIKNLKKAVKSKGSFSDDVLPISVADDKYEFYTGKEENRKWKKENGLTSVEVEIPEGATAEIILKNGINETKNGGVYKYTLIDNKP